MSSTATQKAQPNRPDVEKKALEIYRELKKAKYTVGEVNSLAYRINKLAKEARI